MDAAFEDLSDELHCEIFRLVILQPRPKPYTQPTSLTKLARLRAVCTTWRDLIDGTPHLWSFLHSDDLHHVTKRALRRSKGAALHITCVERGSDLRSDWSSRNWYMSVPDPESHATTFLELVMPQMPRWREAILVNVDWESMKDLQRNPAPRLQRLVLDTDEDAPSPLILFGGMAPLLKHVVCMGAPLRWDSAVLSGLLSLNIRLDNRFKVGPNNLVQLLANSPQIVSLRLCQEGRNDVRVPPGTPTMHLSCLKQIDLQLPSLFAESLLKVVRAPVCESFSLLTKRGSTATLQTTIPFLRSCITTNLARRSGRLRMRFSLSDDLFQCWVAHDGEDDGIHHFYEPSFENVDATKLFDSAAGVLPAATTEKIPITLAFNFGLI